MLKKATGERGRNLFSDLVSSPKTHTALPSITRPSALPPGHHLVYFPPQVTLSQLLPDGTDTLHTPGTPFNRRLWAGGGVRFLSTNKLILDGGRAACIEGIRDVIVKGHPGEEKIIVKIERRIGAVLDENEAESDIRDRIWSGEDGGVHPSIIESRDLVFMRDKTPSQLELDKAKFSQVSRTIKRVLSSTNMEENLLTRFFAVEAPTNPEFRYPIMPTKALLFRFSALTFNAHLIHLDKNYTQNVEGYRNLLVHGPLTLTLLLTALRRHLDGKGTAITDIEYKNLAPLYVEEELTICGKPKSINNEAAWDVWIEGSDGGLAVRGTTRVDVA
ncbi:uncharacterized protein BJX67DRAFT_382122 [Aspergillus lucknowensis]|uniref:Hydroxyacyl-thioester dehydratase type 2, mitochondrial n=1 Tax=Aspergillus lucknowensis TaxID=176173 RepID=A0ABR4LPD4_9EURO